MNQLFFNAFWLNFVSKSVDLSHIFRFGITRYGYVVQPQKGSYPGIGYKKWDERSEYRFRPPTSPKQQALEGEVGVGGFGRA